MERKNTKIKDVIEVSHWTRKEYEILSLKKSEDQWHKRGYLPHCNSGERIQSVTIRLFDSLPQNLLAQLQEELAENPNMLMKNKKKIEAAIDQGLGSCLLSFPDVAKLTQDSLLFFHKKKYLLHAWVIMPNHIHFLIEIMKEGSLASIVHSIKSYTALQANKCLNRTGKFWFPDYYDRFVRNADHYDFVVGYIENNPVTAGLCSTPEDWPFSSASQARPK